MSVEPSIDPRAHRLPPTPEEIDAWAEREHRRRAAWAAGPGDEEKQAWARRYRWRAMLGLEESRLGPTADEIAQWAERERGRRQAWLAGPSELEKQQWARRQHLRGLPGGQHALPPAPDEIDAWAARERQRRQEWLAGPSEEEKRRRAEPLASDLLDDVLALPDVFESELPEAAQQLVRDAELAAKGLLYALGRTPLRLWSYFVHSGRRFEEELYQGPQRSRVRY